MAEPKKPPIGRHALIATCATRAAARLRQAYRATLEGNTAADYTIYVLK